MRDAPITTLSALDPEGHAQRQQRMYQYGAITLAAFILTGIKYIFEGRLDVSKTYAVGSLALFVCLWVNYRGRVYFSSVLLLVVATCTMMINIWNNNGLSDTAIMAFPVVLVGSAQFLKPRHFLYMVAALLLAVVGVGTGTIWGWRSAVLVGTEVDRITDYLTVLSVGGYLTWLLTSDMQKTLGALRRQIKSLHESEKRLKFLAQHDSLTHLPNRVLGSELIERVMLGNQRRHMPLALMFVDMDNFKDINDSLGHSTGDAFLKEVASRLLAAVRASDIVCRQGGDEFLIGLPDIGSVENIAEVANNVLHHMRAPLTLNTSEILASCSIGIAVYPKDGQSFEELLRHADLAMYQAKESGRNTYRFFDDVINASILENQHQISALRAAIAQNEFVLHYQPVIDLRTQDVVGVEALVRWNHPKLGLVEPNLFIPIAEKSGLIVELGQWVIEEACCQMNRWRQAGAPKLTVSVNMSTVQFRRGDVEGVIDRALTRSGLDSACLELEVTESILVQDTENFVRVLQRLKLLGIRISIDDFGTGYSNLSYLQHFAVNKLKIDRSFIMRLSNGAQDTAIVNAIIQMAKSLQLTTNAEGIEDEATRDKLVAMGCDLAQGYLFSRPLPAEQCAAFMQAQSGKWLNPAAPPASTHAPGRS